MGWRRKYAEKPPPDGRELLQFDADTMALARAVEALVILYSDEVPPPTILYLISTSMPVLQAVQNPRSQSASKAVLMFHQSLTSLTLCHPLFRLVLVWAPLDEDLGRQAQTRDMAREASRIDPPNGDNRIQSAAFQKARARECAYGSWSMEFYFAHAKNQLQINATGAPLDGHAHTHAIIHPPDGSNIRKTLKCEFRVIRDNY
jgi:hypothetical protein